MTPKPPGFYPDDDDVLRYWDGNEWTDQIKPTPDEGIAESDDELKWHQKKRWRAVGVVAALLFAAGSLASGVLIAGELDSEVLGETEVATDAPPIEESADQDQDADPAQQDEQNDQDDQDEDPATTANDDEADAVDEPATATTAATDQPEPAIAEETTTVQPAEAAPAEPAQNETDVAAEDGAEPVDEAVTTTAAPPTTVQEVQQLEWVCGGQTIQIVVADGDDPAEVCNEVLGIVWIDAIFEDIPALGDRAFELEAWDTYEESARGLCPALENLTTADEAQTAFLDAWNGFDPEMQQTLFPGGQDEFIMFAEVSTGVFCPDTIEALQ